MTIYSERESGQCRLTNNKTWNRAYGNIPEDDNNTSRGLNRHLRTINNLQKGNNGDMYENHQTK